ncbi:hypothetical protein, conserved [Leishmania tarentolae]|uniref:Uncharacterized protein n=1 Tax=Leishmania tarentolae TaxID=5689 RepID=A0A640KDX8_LEITA|nr:hypothetical protein, conserved [Leishmania tarentolae]
MVSACGHHIIFIVIMRLSALPRVAWKLSCRQLAGAVGRRASTPKSVKKTKGRKSRSASGNVASRRRGASSESSRESIMGAAAAHTAVAPCGVDTRGVVRTDTDVADLRKLNNATERVSSAMCLGFNGRETDVSASCPLPPSTLCASALPLSSPPPRPPPVPNVKSQSFTATSLQRRIRDHLAQLVLLSPEPLRPSALFARYRSAVDEETASMCAWAAYAVYEYEHGLLRGGSRVERHAVAREAVSEGEAGADDAEQSAATETDENVNKECCSDGGVAAEQWVLWKRGKQLSQAFRASVVPLVATLCGDGSCSGANASAVPRLPVSHEVEEWMFLSIIFSDAEFRVSQYSGAVSYPALPSLLLATVDPVRDSAIAKLCYALQWGVQAKAAAYAAFGETHGTGGAKYLSSITSRKHAPQPSVSSITDREEAIASTCEFVWLNGAAGSPTWTTAHAQYLLHSALTGARKPIHESPTAGLSADQHLRKTIAAAAARPHTSGHPLVDVMLQVSSVVNVATQGGSSPANEAGLPMSGDGGGPKVKTTRGAAAAAAQPPALGWNEGKKGTSVATSFTTDVSEDGVLATMMGDLPTRSLSAGTMYEINRRLIGHLFRRLTAVPISVARLSTVLRWNLSVTYAAYYRSFFHFLLLTAANPMVRRMAVGRRQRRHSNTVCADVWAGKEGDSSKVQGSLEDEVRNALAQYDSHTFKDLLSGSGEGSAAAALRQAFVVDADVTKKCDHVSNDVMEVMCVRVLPHARPGRGSAATAPPRSVSSGAASVPARTTTFCGYPLRFVEVLPTWRQTPEEVLQYLWHLQGQEQLSSKDTNWLEKNEEPYILVFSLDRGVLDTRLRLVVNRYLDLTNRAAASAVPPDNAAATHVTLHELAMMTLWAHEYGAEMAAELLFVHLLPRHEEVRLHPPKVSGHEPRHEKAHHQTVMANCDGTTTTTSSSSSSAFTYGAWTVEFLPSVAPDPRRSVPVE